MPKSLLSRVEDLYNRRSPGRELWAKVYQGDQDLDYLPVSELHTLQGDDLMIVIHWGSGDHLADMRMTDGITIDCWNGESMLFLGRANPETKN